MKTRKNISLLFSWATLLLSSATCITAGLTIGISLNRVEQPITLRDDKRVLEPVVRIDGLKNNQLIGQVSAGVRLFAGETLVTADGSGSFVIGDREILTNVIEIRVPPGMRYVASKKGKKYYSVTSKSGQNLSPANRIYFADEISAQKAGFKR